MLFRVNSVKDVDHGAGEGKEIESHLYETADGRLKRFFDEKDIQKLTPFKNLDYLDNLSINYLKNKLVEEARKECQD